MTSRAGLPEDGVTFAVSCPAAPDGHGVHPVTVASDWWLMTPHDLAAERVGVALGGLCTCVDLADRTLPAVRGYLTHRLRLEPAAIVHAADGSWRPLDDVGGCCRDSGFPQARDAAAHLRRTRHWAQRFGASPDAVVAIAQTILDAVAAAEGSPALADAGRDPACPDAWPPVLWDAGLAPGVVALPGELGVERGDGADLGGEGDAPADLGGEGDDPADLGGEGHGIPVQEPPRSTSFSRVPTRARDLRAVIEAAYEPDRSAVPVGEERRTRTRRRTRRRPGERADWLRAGVPASVAAPLLADDTYSLEDARVFAARLSRPVAEAARVLADWLATGLTPPIDTLVGVYWGPMAVQAPPPPALVDETLALARRAGRPSSRMDAAAALIRAGTPSAAAAYLADPIRRADDPYSP